MRPDAPARAHACRAIAARQVAAGGATLHFVDDRFETMHAIAEQAPDLLERCNRGGLRRRPVLHFRCPPAERSGSVAAWCCVSSSLMPLAPVMLLRSMQGALQGSCVNVLLCSRLLLLQQEPAGLPTHRSHTSERLALPPPAPRSGGSSIWQVSTG